MSSVRDFIARSARDTFYDFMGIAPDAPEGGDSYANASAPQEESFDPVIVGDDSEIYVDSSAPDSPRSRSGSVVDYSGFAAAASPPSAPFAAPQSPSFVPQYQYQSLFQYQIDSHANAVSDGFTTTALSSPERTASKQQLQRLLRQQQRPEPEPEPEPEPQSDPRLEKNHFFLLPAVAGNYPVIQLSPFNPNSGFAASLYPPRPLGPFAMAAAGAHLFGGGYAEENAEMPMPRGRGRGRGRGAGDHKDEVPRFMAIVEDMTQTQQARIEESKRQKNKKVKKAETEKKETEEKSGDDKAPEQKAAIRKTKVVKAPADASAGEGEKAKVCIVHRDGRREIVDADDPRVAKLRANRGKPKQPQKRTDDQVRREQRRDATRLRTQKDRAAAKALRPKPYFTVTSTILEIVLFICELIWTSKFSKINWTFSSLWSFGAVDTSVIVNMGGKYARYIVDKGEWWRFITPIFLHCSVTHIVFNLLMQVKIGADMERSFGSLRFALLFLICGIGGNLLSCCFLFNQIQAGASGSLFGLLGLMLIDVIVHWKTIQHPGVSFIVILVTIILSVLSGMMPGTDNFAHVGGLLFGIVGGFAFLPSLINEKIKTQKGQTRAKTTRACVVLLTFPLLIAMMGGLIYLFYGYVAKGHDIDCKWCQEINCASALFGESYCQGN